MRDRRVREHSLHVCLSQRNDDANEHGQDCDDPEHRAPIPTQSSECDVHDPKHRAKRGELHTCTVKRGQPLCIVEAMKLFNELEAEFPCVIEAVLLENAQPVEYGAKLFRVRKL